MVKKTELKSRSISF